MSRNSTGQRLRSLSLFYSQSLFPLLSFHTFCISLSHLATLQALWSWNCLFHNSAGALGEGGFDLGCIQE